jgi:hypothetical protein
MGRRLNQIAQNFKCFQFVFFILSLQQHLENFVEKQSVNQFIRSFKAVPGNLSQMVNCEPFVIFKRRVKEVVQLVELSFLFGLFVHRWLTLRTLLHVKQLFETVVVILEIQLLIVEHSRVQSFCDVAELLTGVRVKQLGALFFVFFTLDDSFPVSFKLVEFLFELSPLKFINSEAILGNRLFDCANHLLFFLFENLSNLLGNHFFFEASTGLT